MCDCNYGLGLNDFDFYNPNFKCSLKGQSSLNAVNLFEDYVLVKESFKDYFEKDSEIKITINYLCEGLRKNDCSSLQNEIDISFGQIQDYCYWFSGQNCDSTYEIKRTICTTMTYSSKLKSMMYDIIGCS